VIHPTAIIYPTAKLGKNVHIGAYTTVKDCEIGDNVYISSHCAIGDEAEHSTEKWELNKRTYPGKIVIGDNVVIREFVTVHQPIKDITYIGNDAYVMGKSHIGHDVYLEDHAVISYGTVLGGWTRVMRGANLGISSITHQFTTIGPYAMVAANASVVKDVPPLAKYIPFKELSLNVYAIHKWKLPLAGETPSDIIKQDFHVSLTEEWEARRHKERTAYSWSA
jgi:UDP-N-acetylglucosamine acyltransferase